MKERVNDLLCHLKHERSEKKLLQSEVAPMQKEVSSLKGPHAAAEIRLWIDAARDLIVKELNKSFPKELEDIKRRQRRAKKLRDSDDYVYWSHWVKLMELEEYNEEEEPVINNCLLQKVEELFDLQPEDWHLINKEYSEISLGFHLRKLGKNEVLKIVDKVSTEKRVLSLLIKLIHYVAKTETKVLSAVERPCI